MKNLGYRVTRTHGISIYSSTHRVFLVGLLRLGRFHEMLAFIAASSSHSRRKGGNFHTGPAMSRAAQDLIASINYYTMQTTKTYDFNIDWSCSRCEPVMTICPATYSCVRRTSSQPKNVPWSRWRCCSSTLPDLSHTTEAIQAMPCLKPPKHFRWSRLRPILQRGQQPASHPRRRVFKWREPFRR